MQGGASFSRSVIGPRLRGRTHSRRYARIQRLGTGRGWLHISGRPVRRGAPCPRSGPRKFRGSSRRHLGGQSAGLCAADGHGTPARSPPPQRLVTGGLRRRVRNPRYLAVVVAATGQALALGGGRGIVPGRGAGPVLPSVGLLGPCGSTA